MALYVNSLNCKNFNEKDFNIGEADQIGFLMVGLGMGEVRKNNIEEMVFRFTFLQKVAYYCADKFKTANDVRQIFSKYIGLKINNNQITRAQFMVNCARALERDVLYAMREEANA